MAQIGKKLKEFFDSKGITQKQVAEALGVSPQYINSIFNDRKELGKKNAEKLANQFGLSYSWILTGEGEMTTSDVTPMRKTELEEYTETKAGLKFFTREDGKLVMKVPVVPISVLGSPEDEYAEIIKEHEGDTVSIVVDSVHHGSYIAFHVDGDSMDDGTRDSFERGDIVVVRELDRDKWLPKLHYSKWPHWVIVFGNNVRLKDIIAQDEETGTITCHSLNPSPEYTDFTLNLDQISRLFNVIQKIPKSVFFGDR